MQLATIERRNLISSELERTAEVATQEVPFTQSSDCPFVAPSDWRQAERLEMELLRVQGQRQQSDSQLAGLVLRLNMMKMLSVGTLSFTVSVWGGPASFTGFLVSTCANSRVNAV